MSDKKLKQPVSSTSTIGKPNNLPPLPSEVLSRIFLNFHHEKKLRTLSRCMRVNREFYKAASPFLYRRITLGGQFEYASNPKEPPRSTTSPDPLLDLSLIPSRFATSNGKRKPRPKLKAQLLRHVRELKIDPHDRKSCFTLVNPLGELVLPQLRIVRVSQDTLHGAGLELTQTCAFTSMLLRAKIPEKLDILVLRDVTETLHIMRAPFTPARTQVFVLNPKLSAIKMSDTLIRQESHTPTNLVLIFWTARPGLRWFSDTWSTQSSRPERMAKILSDIAQTVRGLENVLIVGAGNIDMTLVGENVWDEDVVQKKVQKQVCDAIKKSMKRVEKDGKPVDGKAQKGDGEVEEDEVRDALDRIRFISIHEYLEREDWWTVFEEDEVKPWVNQNGVGRNGAGQQGSREDASRV